MITSIIRYHRAIYYIMSITRDRFRPYWVSSGGCKKHSIINMLKKQICHWVQKKCNTKQYDTAIPISSNSYINDKSWQWFCTPIRAYRCDLLSMSCVCVLDCDPHDIGIAVSYCFVLHFFLHPMANLFFLACLLLSVFYTRLMRPNKVETDCGLLTWCNRLLYGTIWCWWSFMSKFFYCKAQTAIKILA